MSQCFAPVTQMIEDQLSQKLKKDEMHQSRILFLQEFTERIEEILNEPESQLYYPLLVE